MEQIKKFLQNLQPREYQIQIYQTCKEKNCLVVLPTGLGKTLVALMLTIDRMTKFPGSKVLFLAPTRPLAEQHLSYFKKNLPELFATMELFTGKTQAESRRMLWQSADIIFSTPQCVEGKTKIFTKDGPISIEKFFEKFNLTEEICGGRKGFVARINEEVLGFKDNKITLVKAIRALKLPAESTFEIKTELGNLLECTPEHSLLSINTAGKINWKKTEELKEGDYVALAKNILLDHTKNIEILPMLKNAKLRVADKEKTRALLAIIKSQKVIKIKEYSRFFYNFMPLDLFLRLSEKVNFDYGSLKLTDWQSKSEPIKIPKFLDAKLSYILGAMLGDGHIGNRKGHGKEVVFSDLDHKENQDYFAKAILETFGIKMKEAGKKGVIIYNSAFAEVLYLLGVPKGKKSNIIRVPKYIFSSPLDEVKSFLKGVFDTDGSASKYGVSISSVSKEFIEDIKWLNLRLGIMGSIESRINKGNINGRELKRGRIYSFRFSGRNNLDRFLEINPETEKCKILYEALQNTKKPFTRAKEIIPIPELTNRIYKENYKKFERYLTLCLSRDSLINILKKSKGESAVKLQQLLEMPIRWAKIKEIKKKTEKKWVYDFTIENEHNFITNNVVSHNCIANDLKNNLYNLKDVSLLIVDECHRCLKNYSYTYVAEKYKEQSQNPRILGLTASPGHEKEKISQICKNMSIEAVEIRNRESDDVKEYLQDLEFEIIKLNFPEEFEPIRQNLKIIFIKKVEELKNRKLLFGPANKVTLLEAQRRIMRAISSGNKHFNLLAGASACAIAVKLQHALELVETQTLSSLQFYLINLFQQAKEGKSKAVQQLVKFPEFNKAYVTLIELIARKQEHPKLIKLKEIIQQALEANPKLKAIIFAQFRDTVTKICKTMNEIPGINARVFVGQAKKGTGEDETGLSQKEQQEIIKDFSFGKINILCATQIAEEGLDIPEVNAVIFYEPIPSAIRSIQRRGRTARLMKGKLITLVTINTRDEAYYWAAFHKEKRMYKALDSIKKDMDNQADKKGNNEQKKLF